MRHSASPHPDDELQTIKRLALRAMFSDDELMGQLVLKGGNALDLVYDISPRASLDLDFSMPEAFAPEDHSRIGQKIENSLCRVFSEEDFVVFDVTFSERPRETTADMQSFWGGYRIEFKVIDRKQYEEYASEERALRTRAKDLGPGHRKSFKIDISKFEYCQKKRAQEIDGCTVYLYPPEIIIFEKLRAICQQMPHYATVVNTPSQSARARDFFDLTTLCEHFRLDLTSRENIEALKAVFAAKRVPLHMIGMIPACREQHRPDFPSLLNTIKPGKRLQDFDYYFDFVVENLVVPLQPFWEE